MTTERVPEVVYSEPEAGVYPGTFIACEPFQYDDKTTGEVELRWRWGFYSDDDIEFDTLTSRSFRPGTNGLKLFTGILGRPPVPGDKPSDSYGKHGSIVYSPNKGGKLTVTEFHADRQKPAAVATNPAPMALPGESLAAAQPGEFDGAPRQAPTQPAAVPDDLPF